VKLAVADRDLLVYVGDALDTLRDLPDESVHCIVTSPPYWGLRDYGIDGQLGLEATPDEYVARMVAVFREARRVLRRDGTCWLNIGDSYVSQPSGSKTVEAKLQKSGLHFSRATLNDAHTRARLDQAAAIREKWQAPPNLKPKDLVGIPWRLAFALQADGWYLRSEVTWCKRNCMPESAKDRPTSATEKVFLLARSPRYFYDQTAVMELAAWERWGDQTSAKYEPNSHGGFVGGGSKAELSERSTRNMRNWWLLATEPFPDAHFATFLGSGTTAIVARRLGRHSIGIELNPEYTQ
jgi:hypothetical protein